MLAGKLLLASIFILLGNKSVFSSDSYEFGTRAAQSVASSQSMAPTDSEAKEGKRPTTQVATDPYVYVLRKTQTTLKQNTPLNLKDFYRGFEKAASQYGWYEVKDRTATISKRFAVLELLANVLASLDTFTEVPSDIINSIKGYINVQLISAFSNVNPSLKATAKQKEVVVRTLVQMGQQEAKRKLFLVTTARQWADRFRAGRNYEALNRSLLHDIFFKTLIAYTAQEKERIPEAKNGENRAITDIYNAIQDICGFNPSMALTQEDLKRVLKKFQSYTEVLLTGPQILDQRGKIVNDLIKKGQQAAKKDPKIPEVWVMAFTDGREYKELRFSQRQDILFKTLITYAAQQKERFSKKAKGEVEEKEVEEVSEYFRVFDPSVIQGDLLAQLQYFQRLSTRKTLFHFDPTIGKTPLTIPQITETIGKFLDLQSLTRLKEVGRGPWYALQRKKLAQLRQVVDATNFAEIITSGDSHLKSILRLLLPQDQAYIEAVIEDYLEWRKEEGKRDLAKVKSLYEKARDLGSKQAKKKLYQAAYSVRLGFTKETGWQYIYESKDKDTQHWINRAAYEGEWEFKGQSLGDRGRYLQKRVDENKDQDAQYWINRAASELTLSFSDKYNPGAEYLQDRARNGDWHAQELLYSIVLRMGHLVNRGKRIEPISLTGGTQREYFQERADNGEESAQRYLNKGVLYGWLDLTPEARKIYLQERAEQKGDLDARKCLYKAARNEMLGFTREEGEEFLKKHAAKGDLYAKSMLSFGYLYQVEKVRRYNEEPSLEHHDILGIKVLQELALLLDKYQLWN